MTQQDNDIQFQIECLTHELVMMLMDDRGLSMQQAMDMVYGSHTFEKLENPSTGLFFQSAVYLLDMLQEEISVV